VTTYALIHGGHHGAWCWDFLRPELEARGHDAVAVDLPAEDPAADVSRYVQVAVDELAGRGDDVVVVGHSLGGLTAAVVAARRPVRHLVYLAAVVPEPGRSLADQKRDEPDMVFDSVKIDNGDGTTTRPAAEAARIYYHDCSETRRQYALARLRRQAGTPYEEPSPLPALPDVPTSYIVCRDDRALRPSYQRHVARTRLGVELLELPSAHAPFLSRPADLADVLARLI
jgi:pimeloyl-ACP methyl ester carboxylesterase